MTKLVKAENLINHTYNHYLKEIDTKCPSRQMGYGYQSVGFEAEFLEKVIPGTQGLALYSNDIWGVN